MRPSSALVYDRSGGNAYGMRTVELPLDPELLALFCQRTQRRRLNDMHVTCKAIVKLVPHRGVLKVTGTEMSIEAVRNKLAGFAGPRRQLPAPVWAELMRTRKSGSANGGEGALSRLQTASGCRIHIERTNNEVRLFSPPEIVSIADRLLEQFCEECSEEIVDAGNVPLCPPALDALANSCSVTLRVEEEHNQIMVHGLQKNVIKGAAFLHRYLSDPIGWSYALQEDADEHDGDGEGLVLWLQPDGTLRFPPGDPKRPNRSSRPKSTLPPR